MFGRSPSDVAANIGIQHGGHAAATLPPCFTLISAAPSLWRAAELAPALTASIGAKYIFGRLVPVGVSSGGTGEGGAATCGSGGALLAGVFSDDGGDDGEPHSRDWSHNIRGRRLQSALKQEEFG